MEISDPFLYFSWIVQYIQYGPWWRTRMLERDLPIQSLTLYQLSSAGAGFLQLNQMILNIDSKIQFTWLGISLKTFVPVVFGYSILKY